MAKYKMYKLIQYLMIILKWHIWHYKSNVIIINTLKAIVKISAAYGRKQLLRLSHHQYTYIIINKYSR